MRCVRCVIGVWMWAYGSVRCVIGVRMWAYEACEVCDRREDVGV